MLLSEISREFFQSIIEHNPDGIFILTVDGKITEINKVVTKTFGFSQDEIIGSSYQKLFGKDQLNEFNSPFISGIGRNSL